MTPILICVARMVQNAARFQSLAGAVLSVRIVVSCVGLESPRASLLGFGH